MAATIRLLNMQDQIAHLIEEGNHESVICEELGISHLEFRDNAPDNFPYFGLVFFSMTLEIIDKVENQGWSPRKAAQKYKLSLPVVNKVIYQEFFTARIPPLVNRYQLEELVAKEMPVEQIATELGTTLHYTRKAMEQYGIKSLRTKLTQEELLEIKTELNKGIPPELVAKQYNIALQRVKNMTAPPRRRRYGKADPAAIVSLYNEGYTQQQIAKQLGVSQPTVSNVLRAQ